MSSNMYTTSRLFMQYKGDEKQKICELELDIFERNPNIINNLCS